MPPTLVGTPGSPAANSYLADLEEAWSLIEVLPAAEAWENADGPEAQVRALVAATDRLDQERFRGARASAEQALQWPRAGVVDPDGFAVGASEIPRRLQRAQAWLALEIVRGTVQVETPIGGDLEQFDAVKVGPLEVKVRAAGGRDASALPPHVAREIAPLLRGGGKTVRLVRG
jgi:hypothetical protein